MHWPDLRTILEGISLGAILTTIAGLLPPIAAIFSIIWYGILITDRLKNGRK